MSMNSHEILLMLTILMLANWAMRDFPEIVNEIKKTLRRMKEHLLFNQRVRILAGASLTIMLLASPALYHGGVYLTM